MKRLLYISPTFPDPAAGASDDNAFWLGVPYVYTVELSQTFIPEETEIISTAKGIYEGIKSFGDLASRTNRLAVG